MMHTFYTLPDDFGTKLNDYMSEKDLETHSQHYIDYSENKDNLREFNVDLLRIYNYDKDCYQNHEHFCNEQIPPYTMMRVLKILGE